MVEIPAFSPLFEPLALMLALVAVPAALAWRRRGPAPRPWLPEGWHALHLVLHGMALVAVLFALMMGSALLEAAMRGLLGSTRGAPGAGDPATWCRALILIVGEVARRAWQLLLLGLPLGLAMLTLAEARRVLRPILLAARLTLLPVLLMLPTAILAPAAPGDPLRETRMLALFPVLLLATALVAGWPFRRHERRRRERAEMPTRESSLPMLLAQVDRLRAEILPTRPEVLPAWTQPSTKRSVMSGSPGETA